MNDYGTYATETYFYRLSGGELLPAEDYVRTGARTGDIPAFADGSVGDYDVELG